MNNKIGIWLLSLLAALLTACGGGGSTAASPDPVPGPDLAPTGLLIPVQSNSQLVATVQRGFTNATT